MGKHLAQIGLVMGYGLDFYRDILRGIKAFAETRPHWVFTPIAPDPSAVRGMRLFGHHGMIAHIFDRELADALFETKKPVVNVSGVLPDLPVPRVGVDHFAVGELAAEHLLDKGFRHFGFVGYADHAFSIGREEGFRTALAVMGYQVASYHERDTAKGDPTGLWAWNDGLRKWLNRLPRPVGILASHDPQGVELSEICRHAGISVPEEVALVGVDNDDLLCELARPSLTSVALPAERIGFEAARLLERLLSHPRPDSHSNSQALLLPPIGVIARGSSDLLSIADADVAAALRFIRAHAHEPIQVKDVLRDVPVSRRTLERRVRATLGRGVWDEIRRVHLERGKSLLATTSMPMSEIARHSGFSDQRQLSVAFRQEIGMTPTAYRRQFRARP
jgi:LacI family transcriptional regulator